MRLLWGLMKVVFALVFVVPLAIVCLAVGLGIFGALLGFAVLALRIALVGLVGYGAFRLLATLMRGWNRTRPTELKSLPPVDPYYEAAMRDLDREMGPVR